MAALNLLSLKLFLAAARCGSIAEAARRENLATSAVSKRISDLESQYGVDLLERSRGGVAVTPAGELMLHHGETILRLVERLESELMGHAKGVRGEVRIAAVTSAILGRLPESLAHYEQENPEVQIQLREAAHRDALWMVADGMIDIAIVADYQIPKALHRTPYADDPIWVVAAKNHILFKDTPPGRPVAFSDALENDVIALGNGSLDSIVLAAASAIDRSVRKRFQVTRFDSLRRLVSAGLGIGFLRRSAVEPFLDGMGIDGRPLTEDWAQRKIAVVVRDPEALTPSSRDVHARLLAEADPDPS